MRLLSHPHRPQPLRWQTFAVSAIDRLEPQWSALHACAWPTPVLAFDFVAALLRSFARGDETIACGYARDRLIAMAVLERRSRFTWSTFQPSQAPMGLWLHDPAWPLDSVLRSLLRALPGPALVIGVTQQDPARSERPGHSARVSTLDYIQTGWVLLDRSFADYWSARDKKVRYEMKRRLARLQEQGLQPRLEVIREAAAVPLQVAAFGDLESAGWKAGLGTALHAGNAQGGFYRDLLERFCRRGSGRIYRYVAGERILAMQLCVEHAGTLAFLKTTYDERLRACAPGVLMKAEIFRDLFDEGRVKRVEFYGSVKEWQLKWIDGVRMQYHVNAYRAPVLSALHGLSRRARAQRTGEAGGAGAATGVYPQA